MATQGAARQNHRPDVAGTPRRRRAVFRPLECAYPSYLCGKSSHAFARQEVDTELRRVFAERATVAIRASRDQAHLLLAQKPSTAPSDEYRRGPPTARSPNAAVTGQVA